MYNLYMSLKNKFLNLFYVPKEVTYFNKAYLSISTVFGCGYFKYGSGTFTSFLTAFVAFFLVSINNFIIFLLLIILLVVGFISADKTISDNTQDPSYIVIDEVVGQLIPFLLIGSKSFITGSPSIIVNLLLSVLSFILFRIFDIYKPWIIGKSEKVFKGGIAIMIDDILAGVFTLFIIFVVSIFL